MTYVVERSLILSGSLSRHAFGAMGRHVALIPDSRDLLGCWLGG